MSLAPAPRIEIEQMVVRVPGISADDAPALADDVLRRLTERLRGRRCIGELAAARVVVDVAANAGREALVAALVDALEGLVTGCGGDHE